MKRRLARLRGLSPCADSRVVQQALLLPLNLISPKVHPSATDNNTGRPSGVGNGDRALDQEGDDIGLEATHFCSRTSASISAPGAGCRGSDAECLHLSRLRNRQSWIMRGWR